MHVFGQSVDGRGELMDIRRRLPQQMEGKTKRAARAYARQRAYRLDCILQQG